MVMSIRRPRAATSPARRSVQSGPKRCESTRVFDDGTQAACIQCDKQPGHDGDHRSFVTGKSWSDLLTGDGCTWREQVLVDALRFIVTKSSSVHIPSNTDRASIHNTAKAALMDTRTLGDRSTWLTAAQDENVEYLKEVLRDVRLQLPLFAAKSHARIAAALGED